MAKKGKRSSLAEREAGSRNLLTWKKAHPKEANKVALKHGAYSRQVKSIYSDSRYKVAKELRGIIEGFIGDAGGEGNLTEGQRLMLGIIRSKYIVSKQISDFVTKQKEGVVDAKGEILGCLKSFCTFTEGMRRAIEAFYAMMKDKRIRGIDGQKISFTWGGDFYSHSGPIEDVEVFPPDRVRVLQDGGKLIDEVLDKEIAKTIQGLRKEGVNEAEIQEIRAAIDQEDPGGIIRAAEA